ncbi:hypothetical protein [Pedobacter foliorum]|uniref:hypothetical protein n=1 Tax=Pedobacter foliorum TaxID=2739058 RepID=UPI0015676D6F|nr:hypothetical protein [Pedobacter foliorum]NRF39677.1 hypothetical protein [Pedobacter foliorum]
MNLRHLLFIPLIILTTSFKPLPYAKTVAISDKYLNDIGIAQDPDVLFAENFNDGIGNIISRYSDVKNPKGMSLDNQDVPKGSLSPAIKMTNDGSLNDGGHLYKQFKSGFDSTIYLRYYVKYPLSSKGYIHHESVWIGGYNPSTSYPNPRASICGLGDQRISIAYEPVNAPAMDTYLYWGDMKPGAGNKCYGNDMINGSPTARKLEWDKWMCVELMIKLNNPASAYNGELKVWQDGIEVGHWGPGFPNGYWNADSWINDQEKPPFQGFRWRTEPNLKLNYLWIEFYDDTSPVGQSHHIKFANLVLAKKYIGPIKQ